MDTFTKDHARKWVLLYMAEDTTIAEKFLLWLDKLDQDDLNRYANEGWRSAYDKFVENVGGFYETGCDECNKKGLSDCVHQYSLNGGK